MQFSRNGDFLATAGQDSMICLWVVLAFGTNSRSGGTNDDKSQTSTESAGRSSDLYMERTPIRRFAGHRADVSGLSWSKNNFILSASVDKTVRLWHPDSDVCLHVFGHTDSVTTVTFHPFDETKFITGSIDGFLRLWSISPEAKELEVAHVEDIVTTSNINRDGKTAIVGTYGGRCKFYSLTNEVGEWSLRHTTQLEVRSRRGKNVKAKKITGFTFVPHGDEFLVTSNDSRIRLYRNDDKTLVCKFFGHQNLRSSLFGTFSADGRFLISGSEDRQIYVWDVNSGCEKKMSYGAFQPHDNSDIGAAMFAPPLGCDGVGDKPSDTNSIIILSCSFSGEIAVFQSL